MTNEEIAERIAQGEDSRTQFKLGPIGVANSIGIPEVPEEALQEIVANMLLHRDYFTASPWKVLIFDDRIEIISPGSLPNHLTIDKIKAGVSVARNPVLFTFATKEIPYRGLGSGVKRILEIVKDIEFKSDDELNLFTVIVKRKKGHETVKGQDKTINDGNEIVNEEHGAGSQKNEVVNDGGEVVNNDLEVVKEVSEVVKEVSEVVKEVSEVVKEVSEVVKEVSEVVKEVVRRNPGIRKPHLMPLVCKSRATVERALANLMAKGLIEFRGAPKNGGYYIKGSTEKDG